MTDLDKLIDAVEGAWWYGDTTSFFEHAQHMQMYAAFNGSLDAAKALHEALLPGWFVEINLWTTTNGGALVSVGNKEATRADTPARAWLLAILKAYRAQQGNA